MPRHYRKKTSKRKPTRYRRKKKYNPYTSNKLSPFPTSERRTLRYHQSVTINPGTGGAFTTFRANSLFDPFQPFGGHQPRGFDELMSYYKFYEVLHAKMTIKFAWNLTADIPVNCGIALRSLLAEQMNTADDILENTKRVYGTLKADLDSQVVKTYSLNLRKFFNVKNLIDNEQYKGTSLSDPSEVVYFHPFVYSLNPGGDAAPIVMDIMIEFDSLFTDPEYTAASTLLKDRLSMLPRSEAKPTEPKEPSETESVIHDNIEYETILVPKKR